MSAYSTVEEALTVACPMCHVKAGEVCVYRPASGLAQYHLTDRARARQALTGTPTKVPHTARREAYWKKSIKAWNREVRAIKVPSPEVIAYRDEQQREYEDMRAWLRDNWVLLFSIVS